MDPQPKHPPHLPFHKPALPPINHQPIVENNVPKPVSPPPPPHPIKQDHKVKRSSLIKSIIIGTFLAGLVGFILNQFNININVILPVIAPVWIGSTTLFYQVFKER